MLLSLPLSLSLSLSLKGQNKTIENMGNKLVDEM